MNEMSFHRSTNIMLNIKQLTFFSSAFRCDSIAPGLSFADVYFSSRCVLYCVHLATQRRIVQIKHRERNILPAQKAMNCYAAWNVEWKICCLSLARDGKSLPRHSGKNNNCNREAIILTHCQIQNFRIDSCECNPSAFRLSPYLLPHRHCYSFLTSL